MINGFYKMEKKRKGTLHVLSAIAEVTVHTSC